jgi:hypothetical protein
MITLKQEDSEELVRTPPLRPPSITANSQGPLSEADDVEIPEAVVLVPFPEQLDRKEICQRASPPFRIEVSDRPQNELQMLRRDLATTQESKEVLEALLQERAATVVSLSRKLSESQKECEERERRILCAEIAISEFNDRRGDTAASKLYQQEQQIDHLQRVLKEAQATATFAKLAFGTFHVSRPADIEGKMQAIDNEMKEFLIDFDDQHSMRIPSFTDKNDRKILLCTCLGLGVDTFVSVADLPIDLKFLGLRAVILSMTGASLCHWVFGNNFEWLASGPSHLVDEYRQHLRVASMSFVIPVIHGSRMEFKC